MIRVASIIVILLASQFSPAAQAGWVVVEHSRAAGLFAPFAAETQYYATVAFGWEVSDYRDTILTYYVLLRAAVLHNKLREASRYLGIMLALMLKAKGITEASSPDFQAAVEGLDWDSVPMIPGSPGEVVDWWLSRQGDVKSLARDYASAVLSLLDQLPIDAFTRLMSQPGLRELYLASFAAIAAASAYFTFKRSKVEAVRVEVESPP